MLLIGEYNAILEAADRLSIKNKVYLVNLSSANLKIQPSSLFYVPKSNMETNIYDMEYANYIFNNTQQRIEFLNIIHNLLIGNDVLIMIGNYPGMYEMGESLLKLIQSRYGYRGYFINTSDLNDLSMFDNSRFSVPGLMLFDEEKIELDELFLEQEKMNKNIKRLADG